MSEPTRHITRRSLLAWSVAGLAAAAGALAYAKREAIGLLRDKLRDNLPPYRLDANAPTGPLPEPEMATVLSLARVLVPWREGEALVARITREYVDGRCRYQPGALSLFRATAAYLDRAASRERRATRFTGLDPEQQRAIVAEMIPAPIRSRRDWRHSWNLLFRYEQTRITELVANEILLNFYDHDESWGYLQAI